MKSFLFWITGVIVGIVASLLAAAGGLLDFTAPTTGPTREWGEFSGTPKVEILGDGRLLRLLEDFAYIDPRKKTWVAQKEMTVDGASIPMVFWSITGGPLEGQFRNASIIHDEACVRKTESWQDVHRMFYEACRCGGVPELKAKVMYAAVYHFGPRWERRTVQEVRTVIGPDGKKRTITIKQSVPRVLHPSVEANAEIRDELVKFVKEKNPSLEDLRSLDPQHPGSE
jgi:hypothetical protein